MDKQLTMKPGEYLIFSGEEKELYDYYYTRSMQNGFIEIDITHLDTKIAVRDTAVTLDGKSSEPQFNVDGAALSNRYKTGKFGEMAVEKALGIKFSDIGTKGESYKYSNPDLLGSGYNLGCKCANVGNAILIPKKCNEDQIVVLYDNRVKKAYILGILRLEDIKKYWNKSYVQSVNAYNEGVKLGFINFDVIQSVRDIEQFRALVEQYRVGPEYSVVPRMTRETVDILNSDEVAFIDLREDESTKEVYIYSITTSSIESLTNVKKVPFSMDYLSQFKLIIGGDSFLHGKVMSIDRQIMLTQYSNIEKYKSNSKKLNILDIDEEMKRVVKRKYSGINFDSLSSTEIGMLTSKHINIDRTLVDKNNVYLSMSLLTLLGKCKFISREILMSS